MKTLLVLLLMSPVLFASAAEKKKSSSGSEVKPPRQIKKHPQAKAQVKPQEKTQAKNAPAVPVKPEVPEKKLPFELWMSAHTKALEAAGEKKYEEALALFDEAVKEANRGTFKNNSLYEKVRVLTELQRYDEALKELEKPITREQNTSYHRARCTFIRGGILLKKGDTAGAEKEFQKAAESGEFNWVSAESMISLGRIAHSRKEIDKALTFFKSVMDSGNYLPGIRGRALIAAAEMYKAEKRAAEACALLESLKSYEQLPVENALDGAFLHYELLMAMKNMKGAKAELDRALAIPGRRNPYTAAIYSRMAEWFFVQKNYREAQNMIRRAKGVRGHEWGYNRELHAAVDQAVAKENQERKIRERKARMERERKARLDRERKARLEKERKARMEKERKKAKQQKNQKAAEKK